MKDPNPKLTPEAIKSLRAFAKDNLDDLFDEFIECGTWVSKDDLPEVDPAELAESGLIEDEDRCEALSEGAEPTKEEIKLFHDNWLETALNGEADADDIPAYAISVVKDETGNEGVALILRTGYSFSEINTWLEGIYSTTGEAIAHMEEDGWCS
jgi:hypothetical protein